MVDFQIKCIWNWSHI